MVESIERYSSCAWDDNDLVWATESELGDRAIGFDRWPLCSESEVADPRCRNVLPDSRIPLRWVKGWSLTRKLDVFVPAFLVYLNFPVFSQPEMFANAVSTGTAAHSIGVFSPELLKYGGDAGVDSAEKHFDISSTWCVKNKVWTISDQMERVVIAARYLALVFSHVQVDGASCISNEHTKRWAKRLPSELRANGGNLKRMVGDIVNREARTVDLSILCDSIATCSAYLSAEDEPNRWSQRVLDLLHMDMNRFGLNIPEECVAGIVAKYLQADRK